MPFRSEQSSPVDAVDALLPQTQCAQCGFRGCRPYADAIVAGQADINRCAPGGDAGVRVLAALLGVAQRPLDPRFGTHEQPSVAVIDEPACIGCTLCIKACPVDAIVGASKWMHTVIAAECTGCRLCIPPCPVDCITIVPTGEADTHDRSMAVAIRARRRYDARNARLARDSRAHRKPVDDDSRERDKRATIARAVARARERLARSRINGSENK